MEKQAVASLYGQQVLAQLHASLEGLSSSEAEARRATSGPNVLTKSKYTALDVLYLLALNLPLLPVQLLLTTLITPIPLLTLPSDPAASTPAMRPTTPHTRTL